MVVSLKANRKRILAFLLLAAIVAAACFFLQSRGEEAPQPIPGGTNEEREAFLQSFGWQVQEEPAETREVMIPAQFNDVYTAYNVMQQAQGFDLRPYAGQVCTQYLYKVENHPGDDEVYATLLVCGDQIIGGDVASTRVDGFMHGFAPDSAHFGETAGTASPTPGPSASASALPEASAPSAAESPAAGESAPESAVTESAVTESTPTESAPETQTAGEPLPEDAYPID